MSTQFAARTRTWTPLPQNLVVGPGVIFGQDQWDLTPLSGRPTARHLTLNFAQIPPALRYDVKHLVHVMLTVDAPLERLERNAMARVRVAPSTIKASFVDIARFASWTDARGHDCFDTLTDDDLRAYAAAVAAEPLGQNPKARRLFAVSRFWLYAPYLRPQARLIQPFWEREGIDTVVGPSEWTPENKSQPVHPATMSALLVWCLHLVDQGPNVADALAVTRLNPRPRVRQNMRPTTAATLAPDTAPWLTAAIAEDPVMARRAIATACLITVAYLTGMRADEVLSLERGCCTPIPGDKRGYELHGRTYKAAIAQGRAIPGGVERDVPWRAIKPVADAIAVIESLHDADILFPQVLFKRWDNSRAPFGQCPTSNARREAIQNLQAWCTAHAAQPGAPECSIPPDPDGAITLRRLRRTLAWFVYRRPRGRIALGIQYGHLHSATTDGYGSRASVGLRDLFPMEEAFALRDTLADAADYLSTHPTVSGPAAARYRHAVATYQARYAGLTLTARQTRELASNPNLRVYDGPDQLVACCFDPTKALCRRDLPPTTAATPDLTACDPRCANIARTDKHADAIRTAVAELTDQIDDPATSLPIAARLNAQIERKSSTLQEHEKQRRRAGTS